MLVRKVFVVATLAASSVLANFVMFSTGGQCQVPDGQRIAMTLLPIVHSGGQEFLITPKGYRVQIPGTGIDRHATSVAMYTDAANNYWYINKKGEPTEVKPELVQSAMAQIQAQIQHNEFAAQTSTAYTPQNPYAPAQYGQQIPPNTQPVQQTTIVQQPASNNSGALLGAGVNAAAAGMNMSAAIMNMSNGYYGGSYGVPYGRPIYAENGYHGATGAAAVNSGNKYYYNNNGTKNYVNANNNNQKYFNQFDKQGAWADKDNWSKNLQNADHSAGRFGGFADRFRGAGGRFRR